MIYISTGGFKNLNAIQAIKLLAKYKIYSFELSGGTYIDNLDLQLKDLPEEFKLIIHNYFPPPKTPFVLNLASLNENIYLKSFSHIKKSIKLASLLKSPYYSFHAGFLIDPNVKELGKNIKARGLYDKSKSLERFISSLKLLSQYASRYKVKLLVENNVLTKSNLIKFESNPLLMTDIKSTQEIVKSFDDNLFFLCDVAHLKVSAQTLNFDPSLYLEIFKDQIGGYHLSDNDGLSDSNKMVSKKSWFWPHIRKDLPYYTLEVYDQNPSVLYSQLELAQHMIYR